MEPVLLVGSGVAVLVVATLLRLRISGPSHARPLIVVALTAAGAVLVLFTSVASATHTEITSGTIGWFPSFWNGYKVYISAPTHIESGSPGRECGWEENINGRHWNNYAASVNTGGAGSFFDRHYYVIISGNPRDNSYPSHVSYGNSWGAHVYITTHTNASGTCGTSPSYLRVMNYTPNANSTGLANELSADLDPALPGNSSPSNCDGLYECFAVSAPHIAYVELFFHTNWAAVNWYQGAGCEGCGGVVESWRYGMAVDVRLGYPR